MSKFPKLPKWDFRDVSLSLKIFREFLLGRKHNLHGRFPPIIAPRTLPPADIPRTPFDSYANKYYYKRSAFRSVKPPVVAPVAEGPPLKRDPLKSLKHYPPGSGLNPDAVCFSYLPTPGTPWWWDGHCYFETLPEPEKPTCPPSEIPKPPVDACSRPCNPCDPCAPVPPPCPPSPDKMPKN